MINRYYWNRSTFGTRGMSTFNYGFPIAYGHRIRTGSFRRYQRRRCVLD